jgi:hypothetical protein
VSEVAIDALYALGEFRKERAEEDREFVVLAAIEEEAQRSVHQADHERRRLAPTTGDDDERW